MNIRYIIIYTCFFYTALGQSDLTAIASDGIEWGRFRFIPAITVSESYSDNLYLTNENGKEDYITSITPEFSLDLAIVPKNYFSLKYRGDYLSYSDADNFKENHHYSSLSFNSETAKGSHFIAGISAQDTAIQPFSELERSKDYTIQSAYVDILAKLGKLTEIGTEYSRQDREFDEHEFIDDDFTRDTWDFHVLYTRSLIWPLLLQYRYVSQDNNDLGATNSDFHTDTIFLGGRWRPDKKFSGVYRIGYKWAEFERSGADVYEGYAADIDIAYAYSDYTQFTLTAQSTIESPTRSARESGEYYENKRIGIIITHRKWERITSRLNFFYRNINYKDIQSSEDVRADDYYRIGLSLSYSMRKWISFSLGYRYQENTSDIEGEDYSENEIKFGISMRM
ncbi:MAG: outer membrane beta-barrel protein [Desulfobacteraceae bacterium]|jgi:hypothetical protein